MIGSLRGTSRLASLMAPSREHSLRNPGHRLEALIRFFIAMLAYLFGSVRRRQPIKQRLVYDAYLVHRKQGAQAALAFLAASREQAPAGVFDLFRSMQATTDADWLNAINAWALANGLPAMALRPGDSSRFHRLTFVHGEPVESPDKVSVIMATHNSERTVVQAARSILEQTWHNLELIIVDDCSTDGTAALLAHLETADSRVHILHNSRNVGPYVSKNRALSLATGRYVTCHDADDLALPTRLADQVKPLLTRTGSAASLAFMLRVDTDGAFCYPAKVGDHSYDGIARRAAVSLLMERRLLHTHLGFWDSVRYGADSEMLARVACLLGDRLVTIHAIVMVCLSSPESLTNRATQGVSFTQGLSTTRRRYRRAWKKWHRHTKPESRYLPFPHSDRLFPAPSTMIVPEDDIWAVAGLSPHSGYVARDID